MAATPEFLNLWPTQLFKFDLPGHDKANPLLAQWILDADQAARQLTTQYLDTNFFAEAHPVVQWLKQSVQRAVIDYARHAGIQYPLEFAIQGWANVNQLGDYHNLHNHPHAWLSGTYYVQVPKTDDLPPGRNDRTPNCISFYDPRPQANMLAIADDPQVDPEHRLHPHNGLIMLWPAFLHHSVHPNLSHTPRISVSFNIVLKWSDDYLPKGHTPVF